MSVAALVLALAAAPAVAAIDEIRLLVEGLACPFCTYAIEKNLKKLPDGTAGIGIGEKGRIYVADFYNDRIEVFDGKGRFLRSLGKEGHGIGEFYYPTDVALGADGTLLVADAYNHRIQAVTSEGRPIDERYDIGKVLEGGPPLNVPTGVAVDSMGRIHVADSANKRAVLLDPKGGFLAEWKLAQDEHPEIYSPTRVTVTGDRAYFVDTSNNRIVLLDIR